MRRRTTLATQILLLQLAIVVVMTGAGTGVAVHQARAQLRDQYGQRVLAIAETVASMPVVRDAFDDPQPSATIQPVAETIRRAAGASFVVVANRDQIRYSHPVPERVGRRLSTDATPALRGRTWVGTQTGTLGTSVRAKVPVLADDGRVIGVVSVGILESELWAGLLSTLPGLVALLVTVLGLGAAASVLLARRVKRQTFGLEPYEIGSLLEHREAMLHGVREGLVTLDPAGRVTLANDEARRLLDLPEDCLGSRADDLGLTPRLQDVLTGEGEGEDEIVLRRGRLLVCNRKPVDVRGTAQGAVVTLRDRTELDRLARELDGARTTTDALRAQAHEFTNRLHTIAGLLELGEHEEAVRFVSRTSSTYHDVAAALAERVREPAVAALLLAKAASASEHGIQLRVAESCDLDPREGDDPADLVTVVGNLVDNACEALARDGGWVEVEVRDTDEGVRVAVRDSGPGVTADVAEEVFREGFTTKVARDGGSRGLGLALTRQACVRRGGWVHVRNDGGAVFTALLPDRTEVPA